jgi:hypothetical protein
MFSLNRILIALVVMGSLSGAVARDGAQTAEKQSRTDTASTSPSSPDELRAMQADSARMRALLNQMRANAGFAGNSTTPLYREFDLEAQMWQTLLDQMDRHIAEMQKQNSGDK